MSKLTIEREFFYDPGRTGILDLTYHETDGPGYETGSYIGREGIVTVYRSARLTRLDYAKAGRIFVREWRSYLGGRTIRQQARILIADKANAA